MTIDAPARSAARRLGYTVLAVIAVAVAMLGLLVAQTGFLADPHTAVGLAVAPRFLEDEVPMVALATAHRCDRR